MYGLVASDIREKIIGDLWAKSTIYDNVAYIVDNYGNRFMGTEGERKTKDHILGLFESYGLENPHLESYKYIGWRRGSCMVSMTSPISRELWSFALPHSGSTPSGGVEAEVVNLGKGVKQDFDRVGEGVRGKIVMVGTGWLPGQNYLVGHRTGKYGWAVDGGAVGFILRNETPGQLIETGTVATGYRNTGTIPAVSVSYETGAFIERQLRKGKVSVRMELHNETMPDTTGWNVVGDIRGKEYPEKMVLIGAHYDGHDIGQEAASDDILGAMVMTDVGRALAKYRGQFKRSMRFVAFGNEECYTTGSVNYVARHESELDNVDIMINGDALGRRASLSITVSNPPGLVGALSKMSGDSGIGLSVDLADVTWASTSDNHPFIMAGVPTISVSGRNPAGWVQGRGADVRDHTSADTMDKIDRTLVRLNAIYVGEVMGALADRDEPLVRRSTNEEVLEGLTRNGYVEILMAQRRWPAGLV
jgi:Zn-dependent M28 family amino/carboxypeptidase